MSAKSLAAIKAAIEAAMRADAERLAELRAIAAKLRAKATLKHSWMTGLPPHCAGRSSITTGTVPGAAELR
jgi:hypothetical protein